MPQILDQLITEYNKAMDDADKEAEYEFAKWQSEFLKDTFNKAITKFYSAYPGGGAEPKKYKRQGSMSSETGGLYDLFELSNVNDSGAKLDFEDDYHDVYSEAKMHSGRKGYNGLFQLVFVEGYHGGARTISPGKAKVWGKHPPGDDPYWRRRGFVRVLGRMHDYGKWGSPAAKSTPPKQLVQSGMADAFPEMLSEWNRVRKEYEDKKFEEYKATTAQKIINDWFDDILERIQRAVI